MRALRRAGEQSEVQDLYDSMYRGGMTDTVRWSRNRQMLCVSKRCAIAADV